MPMDAQRRAAREAFRIDFAARLLEEARADAKAWLALAGKGEHAPFPFDPIAALI
jgi:hypothetical protein